MLATQQQLQTFGDISLEHGNVSTVNEIIQISAAVAVQNRPLNEISPYRGLQQFESGDQHLFFGRARSIASLIKAVSQSNLILLVGASRCGKSSVVRAGLIPQFSEILGERFCEFTFTPSSDPFDSLRISLASKGYGRSSAAIALSGNSDSLTEVPESESLAAIALNSDSLTEVPQQEESSAASALNSDALTEVSVDSLAAIALNSDSDSLTQLTEPSETAIALNSDSESLTQIIRTFKDPESQWLIFVDRFEELFTICQDLEKRQKFIDSLVQLAESEDKSVKIVLAMRTNFLDKLSQYPSLQLITQQNIQLVTPMDEDELRQAIEQPAARHGVLFEQGLVEEIVRDVQGQAGYLPSLQYTLDLLWQNDDISDGTLHVKTYRELGGVRGALQRHVYEIYTTLTQEEREAAQQIFLRLVDIAESASNLVVVGRAVSRRAYFSEFSAESVNILHKLIDNYLLVSDCLISLERADLNDTLGDRLQPTVEIVHENLIKSWPALKESISNSKEAIIIRNRLSESAKNWKNLSITDKVAEDELWSGSKLERASELSESKDFDLIGGLSETETKFIEASLSARDRNLQSGRRAGELDEERKARKIAQMTAVGVALAGAIVTGLASFAGMQWRKAEMGQISTLSAYSQATLSTERQLDELDALIKSLQAGKKLKQTAWAATDLRTQVVSTLQKVIYEVKERNRLQANQGAVYKIGFSPDGKLLATAGSRGTVRLWDISGKQVAEIKGHKSRVDSIIFSPDGKQLATTEYDGTARLWDLSGKKLAEFEGNYNVSFSPDSKLVATEGYDGTARLWDLSGKQVTEFKGHHSVSFSPDGKLVATAGSRGSVRLWNLSGKTVEEFKGHNRWVDNVSFSPDGKQLATASPDGTVRLWNLKGEELGEFKGYKSRDNRVSFSPDGKLLAITGARDTVSLWDKSGKQVAEFKGRQGASVKLASFSPDGKLVATLEEPNRGAIGTVRLWDLSEKQEGELKGRQGRVNRVSFSPNSKQLSSAGDDGTARFWDREGKQVAEFKGHQGRIRDVSFSADGKLMATAEEDGTVSLWDLSPKEEAEFKGHEGSVNSVNFSPDGQQLATAGNDGTVRLWDLSGKQVAEFKGDEDLVNSVSFSPSGKQLASTGYDGTVRLWDLSGKQVAEFKGDKSLVNSLSFSPDGRLLATTGSRGSVRLWDLSGKLVGEFKGHQGSVNSVSFSPSGKQLATAADDGTVYLWDLSGKLVGKLKRHPGAVNSLSFSPDGKLVATAAGDGVVRLWDLSGKQVGEFKGQQGLVNSVSFGPDGKHLATAGFDGSVSLWDLSGDRVAEFKGHQSLVNSASFSPNGKLLASAGYDGSAKLWRVEGLDELLGRGCNWVRGYLEHNPNVNKGDRQLCDRIPPFQ